MSDKRGLDELITYNASALFHPKETVDWLKSSSREVLL